jgi:hypothetical protein
MISRQHVINWIVIDILHIIALSLQKLPFSLLGQDCSDLLLIKTTYHVTNCYLEPATHTHTHKEESEINRAVTFKESDILWRYGRHVEYMGFLRQHVPLELCQVSSPLMPACTQPWVNTLMGIVRPGLLPSEYREDWKWCHPGQGGCGVGERVKGGRQRESEPAEDGSVRVGWLSLFLSLYVFL